MEQIQLIAEKKMTSKLLKQFTIRTFVYTLLYFGVLVLIFIFSPLINSALWTYLLIGAMNVLFLMILCKLATTDAFDGINTTAAPRQSLNRISSVASIPLFIFMACFSFMDILFFHSFIDTSNGYTRYNIPLFAGIVVVNIIIWTLVVNIYEKRILRKYLTIEEVNEEKR